MAFGSRAPVGVDFTRVDTNATQQIGTLYTASNGVYRYIKAGLLLAQYGGVKISADGTFTAYPGVSSGGTVATTNYTATDIVMVGIPQIAIASGSYGWAWCGCGIARAKFAVSCAQDVKIYGTTVDGVFDDTSAGGLIVGFKLITTITTATDAPCFAPGILQVEGA